MKRISAIAALALALTASGPVLAVPGGDIGTLPIGRYLCEMPGDAGGFSRYRVPDEDLEVVSASSYVVDGKRGSYLLTGDDVVMTSGPLKAKKFHRTSYGVLKPVDADGQDEKMRCVRSPSGRF